MPGLPGRICFSCTRHRGGNRVVYGKCMNSITLSWEDWRAVIDVLRESGLPYKAKHADLREQKLNQQLTDEPMVTLHLTDDFYLRSYNGVRLQLASSCHRWSGKATIGGRGLHESSTGQPCPYCVVAGAPFRTSKAETDTCGLRAPIKTGHGRALKQMRAQPKVRKA